jgi:hypothetical protein
MPNKQKGGRGSIGAGFSLDKTRYYAMYYEMYKHTYKIRYQEQREKPPDNTDYKQKFIDAGFLIKL